MDNGFRRRGCGSEVDDLAQRAEGVPALAAVISTGSIGGGRAGAFAAVISTGSISGARAGAFAAVISTGSISGRPVRASPADQRPRRDRSQPTGGNPTASPPLARVRHSAVGLPTYPTKDRQRVPAKAAVISTSSIGGARAGAFAAVISTSSIVVCGDLDKLDQRWPERVPSWRRSRQARSAVARAGALAAVISTSSIGGGPSGCLRCGDLDRLDQRWAERVPSLR